MDNPWLQIPAVDYEGHMSSPDVDQLSFLGNTFREALEVHDCRTVALLGCATGNGLEHINSETTIRVTAVDIHPGYLEILRQRYEGSVPGLEIMKADLGTCELDSQAYSLIYAGLVFEYLDPGKVLPQIAGWLQLDGVLVTVLQLPAKHLKMVTDTPYASIRKLEAIMKLISPQDFKAMAGDAGLYEKKAGIVALDSGKHFYVGTYTK